MTINSLAQRAYKTAADHGFHPFVPTFGVSGIDTDHIITKLMLIVTELAEATEEVRKANLLKFEEELADVFIRLVDLAYMLNIDLESNVLAKMDKNDKRDRMHGGKLA